MGSEGIYAVSGERLGEADVQHPQHWGRLPRSRRCFRPEALSIRRQTAIAWIILISWYVKKIVSLYNCASIKNFLQTLRG